MIVTAHQVNFLPGLSVIDKVGAADVVIWLDDVQFTHGGFVNRNRAPDGSWVTVPIESGATKLPIGEVRVAQAYMGKVAATIERLFPYTETVRSVVEIITRPHQLLVGLNSALLQECLTRYGVRTQWVWQTHLGEGKGVTAVADTREALRPISESLARMVQEVGGTVYLSGPSGRNYLDEAPFFSREIEVRYYQYRGEKNPSVLQAIADRGW